MTLAEDEHSTTTYLNLLYDRIAPRFARAEPRQRAYSYLQGLLNPVGRRNGWRLAAGAGEATPDGMQRLLSSAHWEADLVRDDLRDFVVTSVGDPAAVLVVEEQQFVKKGTCSVGVQRQLSRSSGNLENCQTGLFLAYVTPRAEFLIDRELYLPRSWAVDPARRARAGVPAAVPFRPRAGIGWLMTSRALAAHVPARWVGADGPYIGDQDLRGRLRRHGIPFVLGVRPEERLPLVLDRRVVELPAGSAPSYLPAGSWLRTTDARRTPSARTACCWARIPVATPQPSLVARWLLVRRGPTGERDRRFYLCSAPRRTPLAELVEVARSIDRASECLRSARAEAGLDQYEVRKWTSWHRYMTLGMLAHTCRAMSAADEPPAAGARYRVPLPAQVRRDVPRPLTPVRPAGYGRPRAGQALEDTP